MYQFSALEAMYNIDTNIHEEEWGKIDKLLQDNIRRKIEKNTSSKEEAEDICQNDNYSLGEI